MNFVGTGRRLSAADYSDAASRLQVELATIRAVVEVEAASVGFDEKNRPRILFEPHIFWKELGPGPKRDRAAREGLAYQKWGAQPYPRTSDARYAQLDRAMAIDERAALRSASWGLGQVMGFNHGSADFPSPQAMVEAMKMGEAQQLGAMVSFIEANGLARHLRMKDWKSFAAGYNGSGYAKNQYDTKLATAYRRWSDNPASGETDPVLRAGSTGPSVRDVQSRLGIAADGDFGPATKAAVEAYQRSHGLLVDGVVGKATWDALKAAAPQTMQPAPSVVPRPPGVEPPDPPVAPKPQGFWAWLLSILNSIFGGRNG